MDDEFDRIANLLHDEVALAHWSCATWRTLYVDERRRKLLERSAGLFFYHVQQLLLNHLFVSLGRLVDPASMGGHENLTLERLLLHPKIANDPAFQQEAKQKIEAARVACAKMRTWRNKTIGHLDQKTMLAGPLAVLPPISLQEVGAALRALADAFNAIQSYLYNGRTTAFDQTVSPPGDAESLLRCLHDSEKWKTLHQCLLLTGEYEGGLS